MTLLALLRRLSYYFIAASIAFPAYLSSQTTIGIQPFGSYTSDFDKINLATVVPHIDIPLYVHKARGAGMEMNIHLVYDQDYNSNNLDVGWRIEASSGHSGSIEYSSQAIAATCGSNHNYPYTKYYLSWTYFDSSGYGHIFPGVTTDSTCADDSVQVNTPITWSSYDGRGYILNAQG